MVLEVLLVKANQATFSNEQKGRTPCLTSSTKKRQKWWFLYIHSHTGKLLKKMEKSLASYVGSPGNLTFQVKCELSLQLGRTRCIHYIVRQDKNWDWKCELTTFHSNNIEQTSVITSLLSVFRRKKECLFPFSSSSIFCFSDPILTECKPFITMDLAQMKGLF